MIAAVPQAPCVPHQAQVITSSARTAVYAVGRRVWGCTAGARPRVLVTRTRGRRLDVAAVRGPLVGFAGVVLDETDVSCPCLIPEVEVLDLRSGASFSGALWGGATSMRLTSAGSSVTTQRTGKSTLLVASLPTGSDLVLDRAHTISAVRVQGSIVRWQRGHRARRLDIAFPGTTIEAPSERPPDDQPMLVRFVAPLPGHYSASVGADEDPRSTMCYPASGSARATTAGQRLTIVVEPPSAGWSCGWRLTGGIALDFGPPTTRPPKSCSPAATPCWGALHIGTFVIA